jgi:N-acyl-D-amino-acid deacylase
MLPATTCNQREAIMRKKTSAILFFLSIVSTIILLQGCFQASQETTFDLIIKGGQVYDGASAKPRIADIGIKGDKIAAIGDFSGIAAKTIDAKGLIVTPGFIDVHSQTDLILQKKGIWRIIAYIKPSINGNHNYLHQGVTTIITGNNSQGYTNTAKWLGWVDSLKFGANVYHLAPAGAIRNDIFGSKELKPLDQKQRNILKKRLTKEMENGAIGISFDLSQNPDQMLTAEELADIASGVKPYGGIIAVNLRNSSVEPDATGNPALVSSLKEVVKIGRLSQTPLEISGLKLTAPRKNFNYAQINSVLRNARREGIDITADQNPYDTDVDFAKKIMPGQLVFTTSEGITYVQGRALPHPAYWGAFARKLSKYTPEDNVVQLNDAIRSMTALPAEKFNLRERGKIAVGFFADIAIIDLKKIKDKATFVQPEQYAEGVEYLVVNGIVSICKGKPTGKKGGRAQKRI